MALENKMQIRLDTETHASLDAYAAKFFPKPNGGGNQSEAVRQIVKNILDLASNPDISEILEEDLIINGDILVLIRVAVNEYLEQKLWTKSGLPL